MSQPAPPSPPGWVRALAFVGCLIVGVLWIAVSHPHEGPVLYNLTATHGIHRWDFLAVFPPVAALVWWSHRWR